MAKSKKGKSNTTVSGKTKFSLAATVFVLVAVMVSAKAVQNRQSYSSRAYVNPAVLSATNLVTNPGFEELTGDRATGWAYINPDPANTITAVTDTVHSGSKALKLTMNKSDIQYRYIGISSNWFRVTPGALVEASAWWKAKDIVWAKLDNYVGWYHVRLQLQAYDEAKTTQLKVWNFGGQEGDITEWTNVAGHLIVPENATYIRLQVWVNYATGTLWVDDIDVRETMTIPTQTVLNGPMVLPKPEILNSNNSLVTLGTVAVVSQLSEPYVKEELTEMFAGIGKSVVFLNNRDKSINRYRTVIRLGNATDPEIYRQLRDKFRGRNLSEVGQEGYALSVKSGTQNIIYLAATTAKGRFYAIQTLRQLVKNGSIYVADVWDKPTLARRGITEPAEWWSERLKIASGAAEVKYNYIWYQGEIFSYKLATSWRNPFTEADKTIMREQSDMCNKHYIDCYFSFRPRGVTVPLSYSSDSDINTIVDKMEVMYTNGIRNFGLSFDDLEWNGESVLLVQQDIDRFNNDIGAAHRYFITEVYNRIKSRHADIGFGVVPLRYQRSNNYTSKQRAYLQQLAGIPAGIELLSSEYNNNDINSFSSLTGRKVNVWDNLYAFTYSNKAEPQKTLPFVSPANWADTTIRSKISGMTYLPRTFKAEQTVGVSWYTMADFAWAPERYNPETSFQSILSR